MKYEISARVVWWIGDQNQMGSAVNGARQSRKWKIGPHVGIHHNERIALDQIKCLVNAARSLKRSRRLMREGNLKRLGAGPVEIVDDLVAEVCHIDGHLSDTSLF